MHYSGACHCGKLSATFETVLAPARLGVRACQCDFCRRHGAVNLSDPKGLTTIKGAAGDVRRYIFALRTAEFLICKTCGVYIAAVMGEGARIVSTLNIAGLRMGEFLDIDEAPMDYGVETSGDRIARRYKKWTPTVFTDTALAASCFGPH